MDRKKSTIGTAVIIWLLGLLTGFSTNKMADVKIFGLTFFDLFDKLTSSYFLPIGGMLISLYYGWVLGPKAMEKTVGKPGFFATGLLWSTRVVSPLCILLVLYNMVIGF
jgi:NSS family neurotransmitter:Na+ symporter